MWSGMPWSRTPQYASTGMQGCSPSKSATMDQPPSRLRTGTASVACGSVIQKVNNTPTSFAEMMGLPGSLLSTTYWLPWYNNVDLFSDLRIGAP